MPNWKSYDSSVRLLSAILAAHPELKLNYQEIADSFGGGQTRTSLEKRFQRLKSDARAIREARARGIDPMTLDMDGGFSKAGQEIQKRYGGDCTVSALENRFRRIKSDAKALNDALADGIDPITISTDSLNGKSGKEIAKFYGDCTTSSLDHRFRPIKKEAQAMRDGIADKYGEGTTAKAVSTRFERLKKEPGWLTNDNTGSTGNTAATGKPKTVTPRKKKVVGGDNAGEDSNDDETYDEPKSSAKKSALKKVQNGRVSKQTTPRTNRVLSASQSAPISIDDDEEEETVPLKTEYTDHASLQSFGNANSGYMQVDEDDHAGAEFYDAEKGYFSEGDVV